MESQIDEIFWKCENCGRRISHNKVMLKVCSKRFDELDNLFPEEEKLFFELYLCNDCFSEKETEIENYFNDLEVKFSKKFSFTNEKDCALCYSKLNYDKYILNFLVIKEEIVDEFNIKRSMLKGVNVCADCSAKSQEIIFKAWFLLEIKINPKILIDRTWIDWKNSS